MQKSAAVPAMLSTCLALGLAVLPARAGFPVADMDDHTLGVAYQGLLRGQNITEADVPSHEAGHLLEIAYAPAPYLALSGGIGMHRFSVDPYGNVRFRGEYGFSTAAGLTLLSPAFAADVLRVTAGWETQYMRSEDDRGYLYSGLIHDPFLGLVVSPLAYLDLILGGRYHWIDGLMRANSAQDGQAFSNRESLWGYLGFTLKSPRERVFLTVEGDASPALNKDWSRGPVEASFRLSVGGLLGWKEKKHSPDITPTYFPEYQESKRKQKRLADEVE